MCNSHYGDCNDITDHMKIRRHQSAEVDQHLFDSLILRPWLQILHFSA